MVRKVITRPDMVSAKDEVLVTLAAGTSVAGAMESVGRTERTYEQWRRDDKTFAARVDEIREGLREAKRRRAEGDVAAPVAGGPRDISFADFRSEYLGRETYDHQRSWMCALEGRELDEGLPGELELRNPKRLIVNVPPGHSKSTVITVEYAVYKICMNPDTHIVIVGKTEKKARKFLHAIKQRLTDRRWSKLQAAYGPPGGFRQPGSVWAADMIYVGQPVASEEKDPTVQAIGIKGDLQGARAQLVILDDAVDMQNAHLWEDQFEWMTDVVQSRIFGGQILLVGTRAAPYDLYAALLDDDNFMGGESRWSRLRQPAVLEFEDDPKDWKTLWPRSNQPYDPDAMDEVPDADGMYATFDGPKMAHIRSQTTPKKWALLYQQEEYNEDATFTTTCVHGSVDRRRKPGPLRPGVWGGPKHGKEGMYTIASMDPNGGTGACAIVVMSVERATEKRYVENVWVRSNPTPKWTIDIIKSITTEYGVNEWVIEKNGFQGFLVNLPEIRKFLISRGVNMSPHHSGTNKLDPDIGVGSVSVLFGTTHKQGDTGKEVHNDDNLIDLPDTGRSEGLKALVTQLLTWEPHKSAKQLTMDAPMALWFAELRARQILGHGRVKDNKNHATASRYTSRRRLRNRAVVPAHVLEGGSFG